MFSEFQMSKLMLGRYFLLVFCSDCKRKRGDGLYKQFRNHLCKLCFYLGGGFLGDPLDGFLRMTNEHLTAEFGATPPMMASPKVHPPKGQTLLHAPFNFFE